MSLGRIAAAVMLAVAAAPAAGAQERALSGTILEGSRVRITAPSVLTGPVIGTVIAQGDDFLVVDMPQQVRVRVPRSAITRAEVSLERRRHGTIGMLIGAAVLGGVMAGTGNIVAGCPSTDSSCFSSRGEAFAVGAMLGGIGGGLIGHRVQRERWQPLALHGEKVSVGLAAGTGARAGIFISF